MDCIVAAVSDLHTGSHTGLCPYQFAHEGGVHKANDLQRWLWRQWKDWWKKMDAMKEREGLPLVVIINGDAHDGDHHDTPQINFRNEADQLRLAIAVIEPLLAVADRVFVIRGTEAHTGKSSWREEVMAEDIGAEQSPDGTYSWWRLKAELGGVSFDVRHHPETGGRKNWTKDAAHSRMAFEILSDHILNGYDPPDIALRAHTHGLGEGISRKGRWVTRVYTTPPWQKTTAFGHRIAAGLEQKTGGLYLICRQGRVEEVDFIEYVPRPEPLYRIDWNESRNG